MDFKVIVWYRRIGSAEWIMEGYYSMNELAFVITLTTLLENSAGREFRISYEWEWEL